MLTSEIRMYHSSYENPLTKEEMSNKVTIPCSEAVPLLEKEYNRISSIIKENQEAILKMHLEQRNLELSKVSWWKLLLGKTNEPITIDQAKYELEHYYSYESFDVTINGKVISVSWRRSCMYAKNIERLYLQAKKLAITHGTGSTITLDEDHSAFLAWS